jgi:hypothetical protein
MKERQKYRNITRCIMGGTLRLCEWPDELVETRGVDPWDRYVDHHWLPLIGPTATALLRYAIELLHEGASELEPQATAAAIGVGPDRLQRSIVRLASFHLFAVTTDSVAVRRRVPPVSERQKRRLAGHRSGHNGV